MSKFKVGDKVVRVKEVATFRLLTGVCVGVVCKVYQHGFIQFMGRDECWNENYFDLVQDEWTIYNNDKPLSELSDEQRGLLFNHHFAGGDILDFGTGEWIRCRYPTWDRNMEYRAKQKSERELFVDAAKSCYREDCGHSMDQIACIAYIMFDSGKFERKALKGDE
jgi:hypothetical protein